MAVPNYDAIDDTEIDPESALTTTLFHKLRDNPLALLGVDLTDPSPVIVVPGNRDWAKVASGTYSFVVPTATSIISYEGWGAGGLVTSSGGGAAGGAGQYRAGMLDVTPLETLTVVIWAAGASASTSTLIKRGSTVLVEIMPGLPGTGSGTSGVSGAGGSGGSSTPASSYPDADFYVNGGPSRGTVANGGDIMAVAHASSPSGPGTGSGKYAPGFTSGVTVSATDGGLRIRY